MEKPSRIIWRHTLRVNREVLGENTGDLRLEGEILAGSR
jgi:hypothetical protein